MTFVTIANDTQVGHSRADFGIGRGKGISGGKQPIYILQHRISSFGGLHSLLRDKIKELCARLAAAEGEEFESALSELRTLLRVHSEGLRNITVAKILKMPPAASKKDGTKGS